MVIRSRNIPGGGNAVRRLDLESQFQARVCVYFGDLAWKSAAYWLHEAPCYYSVVSNCTPETPPDWPVFEVAGGDYKVAKIVAWTAVNFCERILLNGTAIGPWICNPGIPPIPGGLAWVTNINSTPPPYACTHNP